MGIEPTRTVLQSLQNVAFREPLLGACDCRANFHVMRGNVELETTAPFAIEFPLSTRGRRRPTHAGRLVEPSRTQRCTRAFRKNVFACTIAARAAGVSARALSMTKSWIVPLYRVEVTVTPATVSLLA